MKDSLYSFKTMEMKDHTSVHQVTSLKRETNDVLKAVKLLEDDINQIKMSIEANEQKILECSKESDETRIKVALLNGRSQTCNEKNLICKELADRIQHKTDRWKQSSSRVKKDRTYYSKEEGSVDGKKDQTVSLESQCSRELRLACEKIIVLRRQCIADDANLANSPQQWNSELGRQREQLWTRIENILRRFTPKEILTSFCENTNISSQSLLKKTESIDLARDAEELRFKFKSGKLNDISEQPVLLQSVDQLIEEGQCDHFQRFVDAEAAKNDAWKEKKRYQKAQQQVNRLLGKKYGEHVNELNLKRRLMDLETELYGIQASTVYVKELLSDLKCQKAEKQKAEESLQIKYGLIQQFETDAQYKQLVIQNLVKQNGGARLRLEQQKNELLTYLKKHIHSLGNEVDAIVAGIEGRLVRELDLFTDMRICQLKTAELECGLKMPCEDMSINRLENSSSNPARAAANAALNAVTFGLRFPSYLAPECLLDRIREFKEDVYDITAPSSVSQSDATKFDALLDRLANIEDRCVQIGALGDKEKREAVPAIQDSLTSATEALRDCLTLESLVHVWWEQPAQFLVPWVKENNMNLTQWHTQWEINSARMTQHQLTG